MHAGGDRGLEGAARRCRPRVSDSGASDTVRYERDGAIAIVTIVRRERMNAVDRATAEALAAAFRAFDAEPSLSVAVLTGDGGTFCAGADLKALAGGFGNRVEASGDAPMGPTRMLLGKPVIAAVEGYAVAGGLELAAWCDLRVAARNATFGVACRRWGVPLIDGGTVRLSRLLGMSRALDLILTGRDVSAEEAHAMGLVNRICQEGEALAVALELARTLAAHPQTCLRSDRLSVYEQGNMALSCALANEFERGLSALSSPELAHGLEAFTARHTRASLAPVIAPTLQT